MRKPKIRKPAPPAEVNTIRSQEKRIKQARKRFERARVETDRDQLSAIETHAGTLFPGYYAKHQNFKNVAELVVGLLTALHDDAEGVKHIDPPIDGQDSFF